MLNLRIYETKKSPHDHFLGTFFWEPIGVGRYHFESGCDALIACILSVEYAQLTFSLLTVYHLFMQHYIFKDHIGRNDV